MDIRPAGAVRNPRGTAVARPWRDPLSRSSPAATTAPRGRELAAAWRRCRGTGGRAAKATGRSFTGDGYAASRYRAHQATTARRTWLSAPATAGERWPQQVGEPRGGRTSWRRPLVPAAAWRIARGPRAPGQSLAVARRRRAGPRSDHASDALAADG